MPSTRRPWWAYCAPTAKEELWPLGVRLHPTDLPLQAATTDHAAPIPFSLHSYICTYPLLFIPQAAA